jgi:hypothetical protein
MGSETLAVKIMNHFDGSPGGINEYDGQYGTGKPIKSGDVLQGVIRFQLLPPAAPCPNAKSR